MRLNVKHVMLMVMILFITACKILFNNPEEYFGYCSKNNVFLTAVIWRTGKTLIHLTKEVGENAVVAK